jgi:hypothetical protein
MSFLFRRKSKAGGEAPLKDTSTTTTTTTTATSTSTNNKSTSTTGNNNSNKPPLPPSSNNNNNNTKNNDETNIERADDLNPDSPKRNRASRRVSQTLVGKPLTYNAFLTQQIKEQKPDT